MIPILILSACAPAAPTGPRLVTNRQASPTSVDSTAAAQSTQPAAPIAPSQPPPFDVRLTAVRSGAKIVRSGGTAIDVQETEMMDVKVDDGIEVLSQEGQEEQSYSILDFSDNLEVELFSNTSVFLADLKQEPGGSTHVTLHLDSGNMFVHLNDQTASRATVQTPYTTIRTLTGGAEFDVCYNDELTCVLVTKGVVEVIAKNKNQIVKAGEAGFVLENELPSLPICAPTPAFIDWEGQYRESANTPPLEQGIAQLPQEPCPVTPEGLPVNARILYQDQFVNPFSGWERGQINNFTVRYAGLNFYRVQAARPDDPYLAFVPDGPAYGDANVDIRAIADSASGGDFRYGLVLRRTGDQYYAFTVSPLTRKWYFLKNSSEGLEILKEGTDDRMRGLEAREALRVEALGSIFFLYINGRFIDWLSDSEYASGEAGLFVESIDSPDAMIRFDSIIVWDVPPVLLIPDTGGREYCYNTTDDDGDRLIDRADPDCQRKDPTPTPRPTNTLRPANTSTPRPSNTPQPTNTRPTSTPRPTRTRTHTPEPPPSPTNEPPPTAISQPPTATQQPPTQVQPTATNEPDPTEPPVTEPPATEPPQATEPPEATEPPATGEPIISTQTGSIGVKENSGSVSQRTRSHLMGSAN